jgi:hypothetical protein
MPRKPIDYSKTIIYKLVCKDLNIHNLYVGHTTNMINRRKTHKSDCNNVNSKHYNEKKIKIIRLNGGWDNWSMILIQPYPCNNINEAIAHERYWAEILDSRLNTYVPGRSQKECYRDNREQRLKSVNQYHKTNRVSILKKLKLYREANNYKITCITCNCFISNMKIKNHEQTKKHQNNLNLCAHRTDYEHQWFDVTPCTKLNHDITLIEQIISSFH